MPHTHWSEDRGPVCSFRTKKECDEAYRAYQDEQFEKLAQRAADHWNPALRSRMGKNAFTQRVLEIVDERRSSQEGASSQQV